MATLSSSEARRCTHECVRHGVYQVSRAKAHPTDDKERSSVLGKVRKALFAEIIEIIRLVYHFMHMRRGVFAVGALTLAIVGGRAAAQLAQAARQPAAILIDYPLDGSVFPPEFPAPLVLWRDTASHAASWTVEATFADGGPPIRVDVRGEHMRVGPIDPRCVSPTNALPKLTAEQAAAHSWRPDAETWRAIRKRSTTAAATLRITGYAEGTPGRAVSHGQVTIAHVPRPGGRAHLLPRRAADARGDRERRHQAAGHQRDSADRLAAPQCRREQQSSIDGGHTQLRQLPLRLARRQDARAWTWMVR